MKRSLSEWLSWQETLHLSEIDLGLERIGKVAKKLGILSPPFPIITVAGTNGKGSSVALLESVLRAEGYKTGAYTSPHIIRYNERIAINNLPCDDEAICSAFEKIDAARRISTHYGLNDKNTNKNNNKSGNQDISLTYFEFGTLAAMLCFIEQKVDVAILEVGLGGRLDAANIWNASLAIITGIAIDHVSWLGDNREKIAIEKSGIMRQHRPVISGDPDPPATIATEADRLGAQLYQINRDFFYKTSKTRPAWEWQGWNKKQAITLPLPALSGDFQVNNAASVIAGLFAIKEQLPVSLEAMQTGLVKVRLPGRMQLIQTEPEWLLDVAHNPQSAAQLATFLKEKPVKGKTHAIFSMLADKDITQVLRLMDPLIDEWHLVELRGSRGLSITQLQQIVRKQMNIQASNRDLHLYKDFQNACQHLKKTINNEDRVVAFGSFLVVSGVLENCGLNNK